MLQHLQFHISTEQFLNKTSWEYRPYHGSYITYAATCLVVDAGKYERITPVQGG